MENIGNASVLFALDEIFGYWQTLMEGNITHKTFFKTHMGVYKKMKMQYGLINAPKTFQRALDIILSEVRWQFCFVYLDEVFIFTQSSKLIMIISTRYCDCSKAPKSP